MDNSSEDDYEMEEESESSESEMEESEITSEVGEDRLSELPNSLIFLILSFLPIRDVVSTTLLSKRWNNLWTIVPCLNIIDRALSTEPERTRNLVNRALLLWEGDKILKFKIELDTDFGTEFDTSVANDIDLWLRFAKRNNVEEVDIHLEYDQEALGECGDDAMDASKKAVYWAPPCLYSCSTIRKMSLVGCNLQQSRGAPSWMHLKSLRIEGYCISEHVIDQIMSGCRQLEVFKLRLLENYESLNIRSSSLKRLMIDKYLFCDDDFDEGPSTGSVLEVWCPNLEALELVGVLYGEYRLKNVGSLSDVTLGFDSPHCYDHHDDFSSWDYFLLDALKQIFRPSDTLKKSRCHFGAFRFLEGWTIKTICFRY